MNEDEFNQIANKTRLSAKSRKAAHMVLVEGMRQVNVCQETGIVPSQLSRVLTVLERENKTNKAANLTLPNTENVLAISRAEAVKAARDLQGDSVLVRNAPDNGKSLGKVLLKTDYHLVQDLGHDEVMVHELSKIDRSPAVGNSVEFMYRNGFAETKLRTLEKERGGR